jgi:hypothetical protein
VSGEQKTPPFCTDHIAAALIPEPHVCFVLFFFFFFLRISCFSIYTLVFNLVNLISKGNVSFKLLKKHVTNHMLLKEKKWINTFFDPWFRVLINSYLDFKNYG